MRSCTPCAAKRAKLAAQLKQGQLSAAAKTAAEGVQQMVGLKPKDGVPEPDAPTK